MGSIGLANLLKVTLVRSLLTSFVEMTRVFLNEYFPDSGEQKNSDCPEERHLSDC